MNEQKEMVSEVHRLPKVDRSQIRLLRFLGSGAFGKVYMGAMKPPYPVEIPANGTLHSNINEILFFIVMVKFRIARY